MRTSNRDARRRLGMALLFTGVTLFVLAALFWLGGLPTRPESRPIIAGALAVAGVVDLAVGGRLLRER